MGALPPRYSFVLNPHADVRFTRSGVIFGSRQRQYGLAKRELPREGTAMIDTLVALFQEANKFAELKQLNEWRGASITVTLSIQLMTFASAMIAAQAAVVTFALDKRQVIGTRGNWFWAAVIAALLLFFVSAILGGVGIDILCAEGARGKWNSNAPIWFFRVQTILVLFAFFCLITSVIASTRCDSKEDKLETLRKEVEDLKHKVEARTTSQGTLQESSALPAAPVVETDATDTISRAAPDGLAAVE